MYPKTTDLKDAFKIVFNRDENDEEKKDAFHAAYSGDGVMLKLVSSNMRAKRSRMLCTSKKETWDILGCARVRTSAPAKRKEARMN